MMSEDFSKKLVEISKIIGEKGDGISYILHESDNYTIGTKIYSEKIVQYLNENVKNWKGAEADSAGIKKKKGKNKPNKVGYLWKIPLTENNLLSIAEQG